MTTSRTMLLNNVTAIDVGFLTPKGVFGLSVRPSFLITGEMDTDEQVVVDFSAIKKAIKGLIDDKKKGIDHKTIVVGEYMQEMIWSRGYGFTSIPAPVTKVVMATPESNINPLMMSAPLDAFVFYREWMYDEGSPEVTIGHRGNFIGGQMIVEKLVQRLLENELVSMFPNITDIKVWTHESSCAPLVHMPPLNENNVGHARCCLRYTHGLPRSTSWGCQNIVHGHISTVALQGLSPEDSSGGTSRILNTLALEIRQDMHNAYLAAERDIHYDDHDEVSIVNVSYDSMSRLGFHLSLPCDKTKVLVLPTDTTVENIAQYIWDRYVQPAIIRHKLTDVSMYVSEGLDKGAYITQSE